MATFSYDLINRKRHRTGGRQASEESRQTASNSLVKPKSIIDLVLEQHEEKKKSS